MAAKFIRLYIQTAILNWLILVVQSVIKWHNYCYEHRTGARRKYITRLVADNRAQALLCSEGNLDAPANLMAAAIARRMSTIEGIFARYPLPAQRRRPFDGDIEHAGQPGPSIIRRVSGNSVLDMSSLPLLSRSSTRKWG